MIIYLTFLFYDAFKRGDKLSELAYIVAVAPANYLWFMLTPDNLEWGPLGAMAFLGILWILCVIRDIFLKNKEKGIKDADDVALFLIIGLIIQLILSTILPASVETMKRGTSPVWKFFFLPEFNPDAADFATEAYMPYKIVATILTLLVIIPIILDLKDAKVNIIGILLLVAIFALPFYFIAFLWLPLEGTWALFFLFLVLFFVFLLVLTRSTQSK
jgi:hypothetical protein